MLQVMAVDLPMLAIFGDLGTCRVRHVPPTTGPVSTWFATFDVFPPKGSHCAARGVHIEKLRVCDLHPPRLDEHRSDPPLRL